MYVSQVLPILKFQVRSYSYNTCTFDLDAKCEQLPATKLTSYQRYGPAPNKSQPSHLQLQRAASTRQRPDVRRTFLLHYDQLSGSLLFAFATITGYFAKERLSGLDGVKGRERNNEEEQVRCNKHFVSQTWATVYAEHLVISSTACAKSEIRACLLVSCWKATRRRLTCERLPLQAYIYKHCEASF